MGQMEIVVSLVEILNLDLTLFLAAAKQALGEQHPQALVDFKDLAVEYLDQAKQLVDLGMLDH